MTKKKKRKKSQPQGETPSAVIKSAAIEGINNAIEKLPERVEEMVMKRLEDAIGWERGRWQDDDSEEVTLGQILQKRAIEIAKKVAETIKFTPKVSKQQKADLRESYREVFFETLREKVEGLARERAKNLAEKITEEEWKNIEEAKIDFKKELDIHDPECDNCMRLAVLEHALMSEFGPKALGELMARWERPISVY